MKNQGKTPPTRTFPSPPLRVQMSQKRGHKRRATSKGYLPLEVVPVKSSQKEDVEMEYKPKIIRLKGGPERKFIDTAGAVYNVSTTGSITLLNGLTQGTDANKRVGRKITMTSCFIRGYVSSELSTTYTADINAISQLARCIIIYDSETNGATPVITDFLVTATSYEQLNIDNRDRFTVLMDKQWAIGPMSTTATVALASNQTFPVKKYIKMKHPVIYNSTNGGTVADINTGALWMVWIGNVAAGTGTDANGRVSVRVRFSDQ